MKKVAVVAAFMALLTAFGLSSTLAGAAVTPANGNDFVLPNGDVYQQDADGVFHHVADVATANAMHLDWNGLLAVDSIDGDIGADIALGGSAGTVQLSNSRVASGAAVPRANGNDFVLPNGDVYELADDGSYRWIPDVATANAMRLDWNALQPIDDLGDAVGAPFASVLG